MKSDYSYIEVLIQRSVLGVIEKIDFNWIGESPYVRVDTIIYFHFTYHNNDYSRIQIGPYKLRKIEDSEFYWPLYVRDDWMGTPRVFLHNLLSTLVLAYHRAIITLAVWNLARFRNGAVPSWRDIKVFKDKNGL